jgi:hypothetical protein
VLLFRDGETFARLAGLVVGSPFAVSDDDIARIEAASLPRLELAAFDGVDESVRRSADMVAIRVLPPKRAQATVFCRINHLNALDAPDAGVPPALIKCSTMQSSFRTISRRQAQHHHLLKHQ